MLTYVFYQYARLRVWMERAPRPERWPWYGVMVGWFTATFMVLQ